MAMSDLSVTEGATPMPQRNEAAERLLDKVAPAPPLDDTSEWAAEGWTFRNEIEADLGSALAEERIHHAQLGAALAAVLALLEESGHPEWVDYDRAIETIEAARALLDEVAGESR